MTENIQTTKTFKVPQSVFDMMTKLCTYAGYKILKDTTLAERSYTGAEDGGYFNECLTCCRVFTGFKRMVTCKTCRTDELTEAIRKDQMEVAIHSVNTVKGLHDEMSRVNPNWKAYGSSRELVATLAFDVLSKALKAQENAAVVMQYLTLTDAMGYSSGDLEFSPEEYAAELKKKADQFDALTVTEVRPDLKEYFFPALQKDESSEETTGEGCSLKTIKLVPGGWPVFLVEPTEDNVNKTYKAGQPGQELTIPDKFTGQPVKWIANDKLEFIRQLQTTEAPKESPRDGYSPWF